MSLCRDRRYNAGMRLIRHPDSQGLAVTAVEAEAASVGDGRLHFLYVVTGKIGDLLLPPVTASARADELWRHTCFEAFLQIAPGGGYHELNFAPSTRWAAYAFDGYRAGMRVATDIGSPLIVVQSSAARYTLEATLALSASRSPEPARLGLSAIIEQADGAKSYWALAHPPGKPDFHHAACFAQQFSAAVAP